MLLLVSNMQVNGYGSQHRNFNTAVGNGFGLLIPRFL